MEAPTQGTTAVAQWLRDNRAAQYEQAFFTKGFFELADIKEEDIGRIVTGAPGTASRLRRSLRKETEVPSPKAPAKPLAVPQLPAGTAVNLPAMGQNVVSRNNIAFHLPPVIGAARTGQPIESPLELTGADWMLTARRTNLLFGFRMDRTPDEGIRPPRPVLDWMIPNDGAFMRPEDGAATVRTSVSYTEDASSFVRMGFNSQTATAAWPFAAASFERQHRETNAGAAETTRLFMTGMWRYPRATLVLKACTQVSPDFVKDAETAVEASEPVEALQRLFARYGHAVPGEVVLGGVLYFQQSRTTHQSTNRREVENTIRAAMTARVGGGEVGGGAAFQDASSTTVSAQNLLDEASFNVIGGDVMLNAEPLAWAETVKRATNWAIIEFRDVHSTIDLLEPALQAKIHAIAATQSWQLAQGLIRGAEQWANNDRSNAVPVWHGGFGVRGDSDRRLIAEGMVWSENYRWGNSQLFLTIGPGTASDARIVVGGRQQRNHFTGELQEISRWPEQQNGIAGSSEILLMNAATWGTDDWYTHSRISLFVREFGPDTTDGFLIKGGRVEIGSANSRKAWDRHHEWGESVGGEVHEVLLGVARMWNPGLNDWGMGRIYFHVSPFRREG